MITTIQTNKYQFWQKLATAILLFIFIFNFALPSMTLAATANPTSTLDDAGSSILGLTALWGLNAIMTALVAFLARIVTLAGAFLDQAITINLTGFSGGQRIAIENGWTISRDIANIFFIFILLAIAISTILRIQSHSAKQLLATLIVVALLVNFSLTLSFMALDFFNILSLGFFDQINGPNGISGQLMAGTSVNEVWNLKAEGSSVGYYVFGGAAAGCAAGVWLFGIGCLVTGAGGAIVGAGTWALFGSGQDFKAASKYFSLISASAVLTLPIVFVFFFGGILLIIRYVVLVFLLVLAPIAFVSYILPSTRGKIWQQWFDKFLMHAAFFPAFMMLLYIALTLTNVYALQVQNGGGGAQGSPGFWAHMFLITGFLIGSLLIARQMGIYAAGAVINVANKGKQYATGYTGALALRNTTGRIGEALGRQEWVKGNYYASRAAKGMAGYSGQGIFAKPGKSRSEVATKRAEFDVAATRHKAASQQPGDFMAYTNMASKEKYVEDTLKDSKALDEFMKNSNDNTKGEFLRIARLKGGAGGEKAFNDAKRRSQLRGLKGEDLAKYFNRADQTADGLGEDLKAMEASQIADLLDTQSGDEQKLKTIMNTVANKFEPEKQDRFYRAAMTGSSVDAAKKAYKHVPEQIRREFALRNTERTDAIFNAMKQSGGGDESLIIDDIKKAGAEERYTRAGNPNRKNWMRRLGKDAELAEVEKEEQEVKETREVEKEFKKTQTELAKIEIAKNKGGGGGSSGTGGSGGGGTPPFAGGGNRNVRGESGTKILEEIREAEEAGKKPQPSGGTPPSAPPPQPVPQNMSKSTPYVAIKNTSKTPPVPSATYNFPKDFSQEEAKNAHLRQRRDYVERIEMWRKELQKTDKDVVRAANEEIEKIKDLIRNDDAAFNKIAKERGWDTTV